ncbi:hypothetical protein ACPEIF_23780 [Streptomyces sp. NPDC012600]|uniref:ABC transporter permease n=2 Tax=Streptomyces TaxID=1883 RepID=A0ABU2W0K0_9ACTN|nr:hypothetical protein [Streptomyces griseus]MDT0491391.1 hypothetical protein [Streptomyces griseus]
MTRALRYALKTLIGPWILPVVIALEVVNLFQRGMPWRGEPLWTVDWFAISLFIVGPLLAGAAAVDAARLSKDGTIHLVLATRRPYRPYLRAAAWCVVPVLAVHFLVLAVGLAIGGLPDGSPWWGLAGAVLVQALAICWYAAVGSAVGRLAGPLVAGAVGAIGSFTLIYLLGEGSGERFEPLSLGGATVSRLGLVYNPGYLLSQIALFALTGAALLLLPVTLRSGRRVLTAAGAALAVGVVVAVVGGQYALPAERLTAKAEAPADCTEGAGPVICLYPEHRRFRDQVVQHVRTLTEAAGEAGHTALVPRRVEELSRTYQVTTPDRIGLEISADAYASGEVSVQDIAASLVRPLHCSALYEEPGPGEKYWSREFSLYFTLLHTAGITVDTAEFPVKPRVLTPAESADIMKDYATCDLEGA